MGHNLACRDLDFWREDRPEELSNDNLSQGPFHALMIQGVEISSLRNCMVRESQESLTKKILQLPSLRRFSTAFNETVLRLYMVGGRSYIHGHNVIDEVIAWTD